MCADTTGGDVVDIDAGDVDDKVLMAAVDEVETATLEASLSAIASAKAGTLHSQGSVVGMASVSGDLDAQLSVVGLAAAKGNGSVRQSYVSGFVASDGLAVSQSAVPLGVAKTIIFEQSGALATVSGETTVRRGFVGLVLSGKTDVAEDSRVLLDTKGALILAAALLGGFGLIAVALYYGARRLSAWRPTISLPSMKDLPSLKELPNVVRSFRH